MYLILHDHIKELPPHPERGNSEISSVWRLHWTTLNLLSSWRYSTVSYVSKHLLCQREYSVLQSHLPLAMFIHVCGRYVQEKEAQHDVRDALQATGWVVRKDVARIFGTFTYSFPPETSSCCGFSHHKSDIYINFTQTRGGLARFRTLRFGFFFARGE